MGKKSFDILKDFALALEKTYRSMLGMSLVRSIIDENFPEGEFTINETGDLVVGENLSIETFTKFFDAFILRFVRNFGYEFNEQVLSKLYKDFQKKYKNEEDLLFLLNSLPSGTFERERLFKLSRQDLENRILERTRQLQETNAGLQRTVDERTQKLREANQKMEAALGRLKSLDKLKSEFIGIAAHQLRTPLSAIKWTLRLVADGDLGPLTQQQKDFLEKGYRVNEQLVALINDLLNVSRIEEGKFGYTFKQVDLMAYLQETLAAESFVANDRGVTLTLEKSKQQIPPVTIDPERMRLVFQNLLDNGIKYNHRGGSVTIGVKKEKDIIHIIVHDTGIGIPKDQRIRLFHKFFRAQNAQHVETEGTGLGLYIARMIVLRHGGEIRVDSEEGEGSTFHITLPQSGNNIPSEEEFRRRLEELESNEG